VIEGDAGFELRELVTSYQNLLGDEKGLLRSENAYFGYI
jgi:hypothetical protein